MDQWMNGLQRMVDMVLGHPESALEYWLLVVVSVLLMLVVLLKAGGLLGISNTGIFYALVVGVVGVGVTLAALVALQIYLPDLAPRGSVWPVAVIIVAVSFVVVAPLMCVLQRARYMAALVTWFLGVGAVMAVIFLVSGAFNAFSSGSRDAQRSKDWKSEVEQFSK